MSKVSCGASETVPVVQVTNLARGLHHLTRETCDYLIKIPLCGTVSSLNVSVATGICLYEAVRQRQPRT